MALEIERKFLINPSLFFQQTKINHSCFIEQGYLCNIDGTAVRVRIENHDGQHTKAILCVKRSISDTVREEYEYPIPLDDGIKMLSSFKSTIVKRRFYVNDGWEVDQFRGNLEGLYLAEYEVTSEEKLNQIELPEWVLEDVTSLKEYNNANLMNKQYVDGRLI